MHHTNMVSNVTARFQEVLQQEKVPIENLKFIEEPVDYVANTVQNTQQQLATQLQKTNQ